MYARDFKQLADAICEEYNDTSGEGREVLLSLTENLARRFTYMQPNFDKHRFYRRALKENR